MVRLLGWNGKLLVIQTAVSMASLGVTVLRFDQCRAGAILHMGSIGGASLEQGSAALCGYGCRPRLGRSTQSVRYGDGVCGGAWSILLGCEWTVPSPLGKVPQGAVR